MLTAGVENVNRDFRLFTGRANPELGKEIGSILGVELGKIAIATFPDSEIHVQIEESIRGADIYIVQPTCEPVNDNLMELLIVMDALKRASARQITAVIPYFGYARQDHKSTGREPISAKLVANLLASAGADRIISVDLHATQIQGFFDVPVDHLYAAPVMNEHFNSKNLTSDELVIVSPDEGSIKRALGHVKRLGGSLAIVDKRRSSAEKTSQENIIGGPVEGKVVLMFDDIISTAGSICGAAKILDRNGAKEIHVAATHGVLCGPAVSRVQEAPITSLVLTDTLPLGESQLFPKIVVLSVASLLGEGIKRIHRNESVSRLFD